MANNRYDKYILKCFYTKESKFYLNTIKTCTKRDVIKEFKDWYCQLKI